MSVGLNPSIRVLTRYRYDFGIKVDCEELLKLPPNSFHWSAISLRTGKRTDRTENQKKSGHLTCSPTSSLTLRLKTSLVLLLIVSICNSGKHFTICICYICNCSTYVELSSPAAKDEPVVSGSAFKIWRSMLSNVANFFPFNIHCWFICFKLLTISNHVVVAMMVVVDFIWRKVYQC